MNNILKITGAAAILLTAAACGNNSNESVAEEVRIPIVEVARVSKENVLHSNVYSSTIQANIVNNIAPQNGARIVKINAEIGDFVSAGQILAEMDDSNLEQAKLRLTNSEEELGRVKQLFDEGGISQSDFDALELNYKVAKRSYENLLENTILRSPVSGVVTARNYDRGDMYGMSQPLYTVQQITPVKLLVPISESDYTKVRKGDKVSVTADALPGNTYVGSIVRIYPTMDAATHTFNVEVQVRNEKRELRPGMFARATVDFGSVENVVIPDQAAVKMQGAGTRQVFVLNSDNTVSVKVVTLGRHFDNKYEVLEGLAGDETIVVKGQTSLRAGDKVEVK
ncbi:MAG: efflux RND transporter periplasmic adaptor subunit [Bacteroidales bacterium]|nr:efflux RND transporter periplasmic adaptor subunit [Bacteroidales bacterium]